MTEMRGHLPILLFASQAAFAEWLAEQRDSAPGAWLRFAKKGASVISLTKAEAIDAALCPGWIDGLLDKYDAASWLIRFTPRKPRSKWPKINRMRAIELIAAGQMQPRGHCRGRAG